MSQVQKFENGLETIGWRAGTPLPQAMQADWRLARVIAQHRNGYRVHDGRAEQVARPVPRFLRRGADPAERPAVGDFVVIDRADPSLIHEVLPRRTVLARAAAGERYQRQIIATNIDAVFVLMGLDGDFNPRRIERYLALVQGSGAVPVIVLTKADKVDDAAKYTMLGELSALLPGHVDVQAINAKDAASLAPLAGYLGHGNTVVLVGSSGAGKSTLTNTLLGRERQSTSDVRAHDSRGRHTTTYRALLTLPSGACLIDTPGMRELKLTGDEDLAAASFEDIDALAYNCRFADCTHGNEPGCAVRAALEAGTLDPARWESFLKLRDELAAASDTLAAQLERKANARVANKALGKRVIDKYGRR